VRNQALIKARIDEKMLKVKLFAMLSL
jgi:hypothetical protein